MNNKAYLITSGCSVVSLAVGAAGGYFFAKKKYLALIEETVDREVEATRKHYGVLMTNARYGQKPELVDIVSAYPDEDEAPAIDLPVEEEEELSKPATEALVNYRGFANNEAPEVIESNIFSDNASSKPKLPPRDPHGKFRPKAEVETPSTAGEPEVITEDEFLVNDPEHEQESVLYFVNVDTVVMEADYNDVVDNARLGKFHLNKLKNGTKDVIYIRHKGLEMDYQVTRTTASLTEAMGMGETERSHDDDDAEDEFSPSGPRGENFAGI